MRVNKTAALAATTMAAASLLLGGATATAAPAGTGATPMADPCPSGYGLRIDDGARIHRHANLNSPTDGLFYNGHSHDINRSIGDPYSPAWVHITDHSSNVTGFLHGSVATCVGLTPPQ